MSERALVYDGERLTPDDARLRNMLVEDLARFHFASQYAAGSLVLDAGCGVGQGTAHLAANKALYVVGVDISCEAVAYAHNRHVKHEREDSLAFGQMDVLGLAFRDSTFDLVTSMEVLEHLHEPERYLAEIRRVLKKSGTLVLSTPNKRLSSPTPGSMWPFHVHEFYPDELHGLLKRHFTKVEMWGESVPVYDHHPVRRIVHWLAPLFKPILPLRMRATFLPILRSRIKPDLTLEDVQISQQQVENKSTLIAICHA